MKIQTSSMEWPTPYSTTGSASRNSNIASTITTPASGDVVTISQAAQDLLTASQSGATKVEDSSQVMTLDEISKKYDVKNMSSREMVAMTKDLQKAGVISGNDALMLSFQPALNPNNNTGGSPGWAASNPDGATNFLSQWRSRVEFDKSVNNTLNLPMDQRLTNLLDTMSGLHTSTGKVDFTNMTSNELGKLISDGKITGGHMLLSPAQFKVAARGVSGVQASQREIDAANNTPVNYVELYANAIKANLATGLPVAGLQNMLNQMEALRGSSSVTSASESSNAASKSANTGSAGINKNS